MNAMIKRETQSGFTLIEIMIVVLIIGILSAVAYPAYGRYILKANRADTQAFMGTLLLDEEKYYVKDIKYTSDFSKLGYGNVTFVKADSAGYKITLGNCNGSTTSTLSSCVAIVANALPKQTDDTDCKKITLQSDGVKSSTNSSGNDSTAICWK